ncbi:MAG: TolC family protein [Acidobacteriota bacterium]
MARVGWLVLLLAASGCATARHDLPKVDPLQGLAAEWVSDASGSVPVPSLLSLIPDPRYEALARRALENNPDLAVTGARVAESSALLRAAVSSRRPKVALSASGQEQEGGGNTSTSVAMGLDFAWEIDVWSRLADQKGREYLLHGALEADLRAAQTSLAARTLQTGLEVVSARQQVELEERRITSLRRTVEVIEDRYRRGLEPVADWDAAQAELASAEANALSIQLDLGVAETRLRVLLGDLSRSDLGSLPSSFPEVSFAQPALPLEALGNRPDVASAIASLQAEALGIEVARKALLPRLTLTGSIGLGGESLNDALKSDPVWSVLGALAAPLINRAELLAEHAASQHRRQVAAYEYRSILSVAVGEIDDALAAEGTLAAQIPYLERAVDHAHRTRASFADGYRRGLVDILDLLNSQRTAFAAERDLLVSQAELLTNRVELGLALGLEAAS